MQLYEAQISKMQIALERADQENSRLEQELRALREQQQQQVQQNQKGREDQRHIGSSLAALRDRVRSISGLATPLEQQAAERLQVCPLVCNCTWPQLAATHHDANQRDSIAFFFIYGMHMFA